MLLRFYELFSKLSSSSFSARNVVRQALEILTPSMPGRMEDGNTMLTHWTKKIILEEGHTGSQLVHILQLVVKHYKVYYPVRHHLVQHIVSSIQRLGFNATATIEQKKLAVDLCEIAIKWEVQVCTEIVPLLLIIKLVTKWPNSGRHNVLLFSLILLYLTNLC